MSQLDQLHDRRQIAGVRLVDRWVAALRAAYAGKQRGAEALSAAALVIEADCGVNCSLSH